MPGSSGSIGREGGREGGRKEGRKGKSLSPGSGSKDEQVGLFWRNPGMNLVMRNEKGILIVTFMPARMYCQCGV
jgi:hypothetical protein